MKKRSAIQLDSGGGGRSKSGRSAATAIMDSKRMMNNFILIVL